VAGSLALMAGAEPADGARVALALFDAWKHDLPGLLARSISGRRLIGIGLGDDVAYCARVDTVPVVAELDGDGVFRRS
jgi:phosphosulfolactate phosphohydrolase-like enzyme